MSGTKCDASLEGTMLHWSEAIGEHQRVCVQVRFSMLCCLCSSSSHSSSLFNWCVSMFMSVVVAWLAFSWFKSTLGNAPCHNWPPAHMGCFSFSGCAMRCIIARATLLFLQMLFNLTHGTFSSLAYLLCGWLQPSKVTIASRIRLLLAGACCTWFQLSRLHIALIWGMCCIPLLSISFGDYLLTSQKNKKIYIWGCPFCICRT